MSFHVIAPFKMQLNADTYIDAVKQAVKTHRDMSINQLIIQDQLTNNRMLANINYYMDNNKNKFRANLVPTNAKTLYGGVMPTQICTNTVFDTQTTIGPATVIGSDFEKPLNSIFLLETTISKDSCFPLGTIITDGTIIKDVETFIQITNDIKITQNWISNDDNNTYNNITFPIGTVLQAGTVLKKGTIITKDTNIVNGTVFMVGTVIPKGTIIDEATYLSANTIIVKGTNIVLGTTIPENTILPKCITNTPSRVVQVTPGIYPMPPFMQPMPPFMRSTHSMNALSPSHPRRHSPSHPRRHRHRHPSK